MIKCVYCNTELSPESAVEVCTPCGCGVWGEKTFQTIKANMQNAKEKGDLHQGSVGDSLEI